MKGFFSSMTGRVFLTLLLGTLASGALTQWLAVNERQRALEAYREAHALDRAEQLIQTAAMMKSARERLSYLDVANRSTIRLSPIDTRLPVTGEVTPFMRQLAARVGPAVRLERVAVRDPQCDAPVGTTVPFGPTRWTGVCESVNVQLPDGQALRLQVLPPQIAPISEHIDYTFTISLYLLSIALLAYLVARMSTGPLKRLAKAARDLGEDINRAPLRLAGASEIRQATVAFNAMQARIRQHIAQRTQMLAAITHDLQTPITRMRLRLEKVQDAELQERLKGDLVAMQQMVREGLDLARSADSSESMQVLDLDSLLDSVCTDAADSGQPVRLEGRANMALMGRPLALRRCFGNVIDNAVKYGKQAVVTVASSDGGACIRVRDSGPGIAPAELSRVLEPFYRIEGSRSRESGGTGLGLAIARNIIEQHGGSIALANLPEGGLEVTLILPECYAGK